MILHPPIFAIAVVSGTLLIGGVGDFELVTPLPERICAKSAETCEAARIAISRGWFLPELARNTPTECRPAPDCFSAESNAIHGFNMPAGLRR